MADAIWVYLHGFLSSPRSVKAQQLVQYVRTAQLPVECMVPELPEEPHLAFAAAETTLVQAREKSARVCLLGSSMGGFYATVLAERHALRAVLINPAVRPANFMANSVSDSGTEMVNPYTGRSFTLTRRDIDLLRAIEPAPLTRPDNYWLLAQMGDEVLDYRNAVELYAGCKQTIEAGGDHAFQGFERYLPEIANFFRAQQV